MTDAPFPAIIQFKFRGRDQIPGYLDSLPGRDDGSSNVGPKPGVTIQQKTENLSLDVSSLHGEFVASGLVLTHTSVQDRIFYGGGAEKPYVLLRYHYFPVATGYVHESADPEKLLCSFNEITTMAYWRVQIHQNDQGLGPWYSVGCDARQQRYVGEDTDKPILVYERENGKKVGDPSPIVADGTLHFCENKFKIEK